MTRVAVYELRLTVTVPLEAYDGCETLSAEDNAMCRESKREIERDVLAACRRVEWPCDGEVMGVTLEDE